jgi:energy-coupling factor transport system permease protein
MLWACAFTLPWPIQAGLCISLIVGRFVLPEFQPQSDRAAKAFSRFILYSLAIMVLVLALNSVLLKEGNIYGRVFSIPLYDDGLLFGAKTVSRLLLLSFSILLFFISTPLPVFIQYLQRRGLPPHLVMVLLLTLHFLDQLPDRIHQIFLAQQARGAPVDSGIISRTRSLFSILSPLVLSSIVESIERGTALELRGFLNRRQSIEEQAVEPDKTRGATLLFLALAFILIAYSIVQWLIG